MSTISVNTAIANVKELSECKVISKDCKQSLEIVLEQVNNSGENDLRDLVGHMIRNTNGDKLGVSLMGYVVFRCW